MAEDYAIESREAANVAIAKGHHDHQNLRELLIWTAATTTEPLVMAYFRKHLSEPKLLSDLIKIAQEGENSGDAPWAAANVIAEFPPDLLRTHRSELEALSREQWAYISNPAKIALGKLQAL